MTVVMGHVAMSRTDLSPEWLARAKEAGRVAWDVETSGLDFRRDEVHTCQIGLGDEIAVVQLERGAEPRNLRALLADPAVLKVFHHAPFDLRFMAHKWDVRPASVACTKIAAKILWPGREPKAYSLQPLLEEILGVRIDKSLQVSDWSREILSTGQMDYAANDVRYLLELFDALTAEARALGVADLMDASFAYLPARVMLDLSGAGDVYLY